MQFLQYHQFCTLGCGVAHLALGFSLVGGDIGAAGLLDECNFKHTVAILWVIA
jgi:hypothetical protein